MSEASIQTQSIIQIVESNRFLNRQRDNPLEGFYFYQWLFFKVPENL